MVLSFPPIFKSCFNGNVLDKAHCGAMLWNINREWTNGKIIDNTCHIYESTTGTIGETICRGLESQGFGFVNDY